MTPFANIIDSFRDSVAAGLSVLFRRRVFGPLVTVAIIELVLVLAYVYFMAPVLNPVLTPAIEACFGESAVHYPEHVLVLPRAVRWIHYVVLFVLGAPLLGRGVWGAFRHMANVDDAPEHFDARRLLPAAAICAALICGVDAASNALQEAHAARRVPWLWTATAAVARPLAHIYFAYVVISVIRRESAVTALASAALGLKRTLPVALPLAFSAALLLTPTDLLLGMAPYFVVQSVPGVAVAGAVGSVIWFGFVRILLLSAAVAVSLDRSFQQ